MSTEIDKRTVDEMQRKVESLVDEALEFGAGSAKSPEMFRMLLAQPDVLREFAIYCVLRGWNAAIQEARSDIQKIKLHRDLPAQKEETKI